jgi:hypothetical protein
LSGEVVYQIMNTRNQVAEANVNFVWDIPMLGAPQFSSNIFAVEPRVLGMFATRLNYEMINSQGIIVKLCSILAPTKLFSCNSANLK